MKTLTILNAVNINDYCFEKIFGGKCAAERAIDFSFKVPDCDKIVVFADDKFSEKLSIIIEDKQAEYASTKKNISCVKFSEWKIADFFARVVKKSVGFDNIVFAMADCPFYDLSLTEKLYKTYYDYVAEYCFADGYPNGVAPEIFYVEIPKLLELVCKNEKFKSVELKRDCIFETLKNNINSFDVETEISETDYRYLRYNFACNSKRNLILCKNIFDNFVSKKNGDYKIEELCDFAKDSVDCLKSLPSYYSIQVTTKGEKECVYGVNQLCKNLVSEIDMPLEKFDALIEKISDYSDDAVINISHFCECTLHEKFIALIEKILSKKSLSVLIETNGQYLTEELIKQIFEISEKAGKRASEEWSENIYWIVTLDAIDDEMFKKMHGTNLSFEKAIAALELLKKYFGKTVYPQFVRTKTNEEQLEKFFRYWKASDGKDSGNLIIQKYDNYSGALPNLKTADLRPLERNACWQCRREMHILVDGSVTLCKECIDSEIIGNAFTDDFEKISEAKKNNLQNQLNQKYLKVCENCDEYYTFNF